MAPPVPAYVVRREFTASGRVLKKGTRVVDPPWPNTKALVEAGYLSPAPVEAEAKPTAAQKPPPAQKKVQKPEGKKKLAPDAKAPGSDVQED